MISVTNNKVSSHNDVSLNDQDKEETKSKELLKKFKTFCVKYKTVIIAMHVIELVLISVLVVG